MSDERDNAALLERARRCFKLVCDAESKQREREREDLLFQMPENQWPDLAKQERSGGGQVPARPMLSISLLSQPMQLVYNQWAKARLGVNLHPVSEDADDELTEIKQGLYRRIERDGMADQARGWALLRAIPCGRGWYRVNTKYDEDADPNGPGAWDQEIVFERILHQENVYMDPAAQKPDFSDAEWALVVAWKTAKEFRREFPKAAIAHTDSSLDWGGLETEAPEWVRTAANDDERAVLVAEYWYKDITREVITDPTDPKRTRERDIVTVYCCKITGNEVLERQEWNGHLIPLIPVIGIELQPVNGERRWQGMIRPARDGQMLYNYAASTLVERMALEPKTPFIGAEGQFEGHESEWKQANTRNLPYLEYQMKTLDGKPAPPPQRAQIDGSGMSLALMALQEGKQFVQATTAVFEPSLGEMPTKRDAQSGRAILALQSQSDAGTSHYIQNLAAITMPYEARVVLDLMPAIYDRPGRITRVLGGEDETQTVMVGMPFMKDPRTGRPMAAPPGTPRGAPGVKEYDLRKGQYAISVDIGKSHQTRLEAGQQFMTDIIGAFPQLMEVAGDLAFRFRDEPGAKEIAERLKKVIAAKSPNLIEDQDGNTAEQAQAQVQALTQQLQAVSQQLQGAAEYIKTEQAKHEAQVAIAQMKEQASIEIARMNNAAKIQVARIQSQWDAENLKAEAAEERLSTGLKIAADMDKQDKEHAHEVAMAAAGGKTMSMSRSKGQDDEREEGQETSDGASSMPMGAGMMEDEP